MNKFGLEIRRCINGTVLDMIRDDLGVVMPEVCCEKQKLEAQETNMHVAWRAQEEFAACELCGRVMHVILLRTG